MTYVYKKACPCCWVLFCYSTTTELYLELIDHVLDEHPSATDSLRELGAWYQEEIDNADLAL